MNALISKHRQLVSFILQGDRKWEWAPIVIARVSLGLFFAISGYNKLFTDKSRENLLHTLNEAGFPYPEITGYVLATVEFVGGSMLALGLLSAFCSIALAIAMMVAIITVEIHTIPKGLSFLNWLDYFLFLPQVMYVIMFGWLIISGPSRYSMDRLVAQKLKLGESRGSG